ncbi:hypothetical protein LEMLEM_LOCUS19816, partial [Lemmus lemmus]
FQSLPGSRKVYQPACTSNKHSVIKVLHSATERAQVRRGKHCSFAAKERPSDG